MSDEPTHEQPRLDVTAPPSMRSRRFTRRRLIRAAKANFFATAMAVMLLLAIADLDSGAPWYWVAFDAFAVVWWAIRLRGVLHPAPPPPVCFNAYWILGEPAFICLRRAGHRGRHREGCASWSTSAGPYRIHGRRR